MARMRRRARCALTESASSRRNRIRQLLVERLEERLAPATFNVLNLNDSGAGSLRQAILDANAATGPDTIAFDTVTAFGRGLHTIALASALPTITGPTTIDGTTEPNYSGTPLVNVNAGSQNFDVLSFSGAAANGSAVKGLRLSGFTSVGIRLNNVDNATVQNVDLSDPVGNYSQTGIYVDNGSDNVVITGVNVSGLQSGGIQVNSSANPTIQNSRLNEITGGSALYLNNVTGLTVGAISGNTFHDSQTGLRIDGGQTGLIIGDASVAGAHIRIEDGTSGLATTTSRAIYLNNVDNATIDNVDVSYALPSRSGTGIQADGGSDFLVVQNVNAANRSIGLTVSSGKDLTVNGNNFSNNNLALDLASLTKQVAAAAVLASGNVFTGSNAALRINTLTGTNAGLTIGTSGTNIVMDASAGLTTVSNTVIELSNVDSATISGLNLAYAGGSRSGTGVLAQSGSDNLVVQNVTSSNRSTGVQVSGGQDPTISNNTLTNNSTALYVDSATDGADAGTAPVSVSGNVYSNSQNGLQLFNLSGLSIGTTGSEAVVINNATAGLTSVTNLPLYLRNLPGVTIDGLNLTYAGASRTGYGIYSDSNLGAGATIQNVTATNRSIGIALVGGGQDLTLTNNNLGNNAVGLYLDSFSDGGDANTVPVVASGTTVTNSQTGFQLFNLSSQFIGAAGTGIIIAPADGLTSITDRSFYLRNLPNSTIDGLDVSWAGTTVRTGYGIYSDSNLSSNFTIQNVTATNRSFGIALVGGGQDLTLTNNNLSNNAVGLYLDSFSDAGDANTVPVVASGTTVTNSQYGLQLFNLSSQFIGTAGTGIVIAPADGLNSIYDRPLYLRNLPNSTIDGLDLSWTGSAARTGYGIYSDSNLSAGLTIQNVTATNRSEGLALLGGGQDLTLVNNNLSNNNTALHLESFSDAGDANTVAVVATGTNFTNAATALEMRGSSDQFIGASGTGIIIGPTDGLKTATSTALALYRPTNFTIDGLDLSSDMPSRTGTGLLLQNYFGNPTNVTVNNVTSTNRSLGISIQSGTDITLTNNTLTNNGTALDARDVIDGTDANTVPLVGSGNNFGNSTNGVALYGFTGQPIGDASLAVPGLKLEDGTSGLGSVTNFALDLRRFRNATIDGLEVGLTSDGPTTRSGTGIYVGDYFGESQNLTFTQITAQLRGTGLDLQAGRQMSVQDSTFSNNNVGITANNQNTTATLVNNSNLVGNTTGLTAQAGGLQVNATNNFWGSAAGPGAGGNNGTTGNVSTSPFLTSLSGTAPALPTAPAGPTITSAAAVTFQVTTNADIADGDTSSITNLLASQGADGAISLREAITAANNTAGTDTIGFNIGTGAQTIRIESALPTITGAVTIDGTTQPGYAGTPLITIDAYGRGGNFLDVSGVAATLTGLKITNFSATAIRLTNADNSVLSTLDLTNPNTLYGSDTGISVESGSDNVSISGVTIAGVNGSGIAVSSSANPTIQNNTIAAGFSNSTGGVMLNGVTGLTAGAISGNDFTNSGTALRLDNLTGVSIGDASVSGAHLVLADGASGLGRVTTAIYVNNVDNSSIDNVDVSWTGPGIRSGTGIYADNGNDNLTVTNSTATNRSFGLQFLGSTNKDIVLTNNNLANNATGLYVDGATDGADGDTAPFTASGNVFSGSNDGLRLWNMTGLTIGTSGTHVVINNAADGLPSVTGSSLWLRNLDNSSITGLDLAFSGPVRSGRGILADSSTDNLTIQNVSAGNRGVGIEITGVATDITLTGNNVSNTGLAIYLDNVTDGTDGDNLPVVASGNVVTNSGEGFRLFTVGTTAKPQSIGTSGSGIVINNATDGLQSVTGNVFWLRSTPGLTLDGVDLSYSGAVRRGNGVYSDSNLGAGVTISNVSATKRSNGLYLGGGGQDLTILNATLTNTDLGLFVDAFTDGADADTAPIKVTGSSFANSATGLDLRRLSNLLIGDASVAGAHVVIPDGDLGSITGTALAVYNLDNSTIDNLDVAYTGALRSGTGILSSDHGGGSDNLTIKNVKASNRGTGIQFQNGTDLTLLNNDLSNNNLGLYIDVLNDGADAGTAPISASGNIFTGDTVGLELRRINGVVIGDASVAGAHFVIADGDLTGIASSPLTIYNLDNSTIDNLDVSFSGAVRFGTGLSNGEYGGGSDNLTIRNIKATNRATGISSQHGTDLTLLDNDLSNNNLGLFIDVLNDGADAGTAPINASGNVFTGDTAGLDLRRINGVVIGDASVAGAHFVIADGDLTGIAGSPLVVYNLDNATIDNVDVSYSGATRGSTGLLIGEYGGGSDNLTVRNINASNRAAGISANYGTDLTISSNNLSNTGQALAIQNLTDGGDADTAPFSGGGNLYTGSTNGLNLINMAPSSLVIGNSAVSGVHFSIDSSSGLMTVPGTAINLNLMTGVTIDGVDVSYRGLTRSGTGIRATDNSNNTLTVKNVTASNRQTGLAYSPNTTAAGYLAKVSDSNFLNNDVGLSIVQYNAGGFVNNSRIEANTNGLAYTTQSTGVNSITLNATGNYWGPGGSGAPGASGNNNFTSSPAAKVDSSGFVATVPSALFRDYGDAPISFGFATSLRDFGARHVATGPQLGPARDNEADAAPTLTANGDDTAGSPDDEDGVTVGLLTVGQTASATVEVSGGSAKLDAWIDFNRDGDWDDAGEKIASSANVTSGSNTVNFSVPGGAVVGASFARFRLSTAGGLLAYGEAADGEVEDYAVTIYPPNAPPTVARDNATVSAAEGSNATNTGTFSDADGNATATISANVGSVTQDNTAGTWSWSIATTDGPAGPFTVTISANDGIAPAATTTFTYSVTNVAPTVSGGPFSLAENSDNGTVVGSASASDPGVDTRSFSITGGNTGGAFAIDSSSGQITVANKAALDYETTPVFNLTVAATDSDGDTGTATVTVNLTDRSANLTIDDASVAEGNSSTATLTFTVTLSATTNDDFTVNYATANGTAGDGTGGSDGDYTAASGTLNFTGTSGETAQITVSVNGDTKVELNESLQVLLSSLAGTNDVTITDNTGAGTITNDDSATVSLSGSSASEAAGSLTYTVTLSQVADTDVTVQLSTLGSGTATAGTDFTAITAQTVTIPAGSTTQTVNVTVASESLVELDETVVAQIGSLSAGGRSVSLGTTSATGTITNDDSATVSISGTSASESTGSLMFTLSLSSPVDTNVTVQLDTLGTGSATAGTDFTAIAAQTVTIPAGSTTQTVNVTVANDSTVELDETVVAQISALNASGRNVTLGTTSTTGTITNDDSATVSLSGVSTSESTGALTFTVSLSAQVDTNVTVQLSTLGTGTAASGTDFTAIAGQTVTIAAGNTTQTVTVTVANDNIVEPSETVVAQIGSLSAGGRNVSLGTSSATGTITNDDVAGFAIVESGGTTSVSETGTTDSFTVALTNPPVNDVVILVSSGNTGEAAVSPAALTFTSANWNVTQTVTVTGVDDWIVDGSQSTTLTLSIDDPNSDALWSAVADQTVSATTTDDDTAGTRIYTSPAPDGVADTYTVVVNGGNIELLLGMTVVASLPTGGGQQLVVNGSGDDDSFVLDLSNGNAIPGGGIAFHGGANGVGGDELTVTGGSGFTTLVYDATAPGAGTLTFDSTRIVTFTGLEPVTVTPAAGTVTIDVDPANTIAGNITTTITDDVGAFMTVTLSAGLESITFGTPTVALIVNGDNNDPDTIVLTSFDADAPFRGSLTVDGQGGTDSITLDAALTTGSATATGNVAFTAETINLNANISTDGTTDAGTVTLTGAVTLGAAVTIDSDATGTDGTVQFTSTINGGQTLAVNSGTGTTTFGGIIGGTTPLTSLTTDAGGTTNLNGGEISVTGAVSFGDNVSLGAATPITSSGGGNVTFGGTVNGGQTLTVNTAGTTQFNGTVGATTALTSLTTNAGGTTVVNTATMRTSGGQTYNDAVTLSANATFTSTGGGAINFANTIDGGQTLTVNTSGTTTFGGAIGGGTPLTSVTTNSTGTVAINGGSVATTGAQTYNDAATLGAATTLSSSGGGNITFASTLNGGQTLDVNTTGTTTFGGQVGGTTALTSVTTNAGGTTAVNTTLVRTTGTQTFNDAVTVGAAAVFDSTGGSAITFVSTLNGGQNVTVNTTGATTFTGAVGGTTALTSLTTNAGGTTAIDGGSVATTGAQTYNDAVTIGAATTLSSSGGSNITFASTLNGGQTLAVNTTGTTTFGGAVGGTTPLTSVTTNAGGTTAINGGSVATTGAQTYNDAVTLGAATTLSSSGGGNITFASTVNGAQTLAVNTAGATIFGGAVGGTTPLTSVTTDAPGTVALNGGSVATTGAQTYNEIATLGAATTLSSSGGGNITFANTLNGGQTLAVNTTGTTTFGGAVGGTTPLTSVTTNAGGTTAIDGGSVATTGAQTYNDAVTLGAATTLSSSGGGNIMFASTVNGGQTLAVNTTGTTTFGGAVGGTTPLTSVTTNAGGTTAINGGSVATTGAQTYNDAVTLGAPTTLSSSGAGDITFASTLNGGVTLAVNTAGATIFGGAVGGTTPLTSITTDAPGTVALNGGSVATTGAQTYNEIATLGAATTLSSSGGGNITFASTLNGGQTLAVNTTGTTTFGGAVGGTTPLTSVTTNAGGTTAINGGSVATTGAQTYNDAVTLGAGTILSSSGAGNITFASTVNGGQTLDVNTTGTTTFGGAVGGTTPLTSVTTNAGGTTAINGGSVATTGAQTYNDAVTLGAGTTLSSSGAGNITFASTVNGGQTLTVNTTGTTTFGGAVGNTTPLTSVTTNAGGTTAIDGGSVATTGAQTYNDVVTLGAGTTLSSSGGSNITFASTVNGAQTLAVNTTGTTTFGGAVGGTTPLTSVTTNAGGTTAINGGSVATAGAQTYNDAVTLGAATTLSSSGGGNITFASTVNGAQTLAVNTAGATIFGGAVGNTTPLTSVTTDAAGSTQINGGSVATTGAQTYNDPVTIGANTTLSSSGGGNIQFVTTLNDDGNGGTPSNVSINTAGNTIFDGVVGGLSPLTSLTTNAGGTTQINVASITTTAGQSYGDAVTLGATTQLNGTTVNFASTVGLGANDITVNVSTTGSTASVANGVISGTGTFTKIGAGGFTFAPGVTHTYTGQTFVTAGTLYVRGTTDPASAVNVQGGTLAGDGTVGGTVTMTAAGGAVAPGVDAPGILTVLNNVTLNAAGSFDVELNGFTVGSQYDRLVVVGTVTLNNATLNHTTTFDPSGACADFMIIDNNTALDPPVGIFAGLPQDTIFNFTPVVSPGIISYEGRDDNDIVLSPYGALTFNLGDYGVTDVTLWRVGGQFQLVQTSNTSNILCQRLFNSVTVMNVNGEPNPVDDEFTIDTANFNNDFQSTINFDGIGAFPTAVNELRIVNSAGQTANTVEWNFDDWGFGNTIIDFDGAGLGQPPFTVNYFNTPELYQSLNSNDMFLDFDFSGEREFIYLQNAGGTFTRMTEHSSIHASTLTFTNPQLLFDLDAGDDDDWIILDGLGSPWNAEMNLDGQSGADDRIQVNTPITIPSGRDIVWDAEDTTLNGRPVSLTGGDFISTGTTFHSLAGATIATAGGLVDLNMTGRTDIDANVTTGGGTFSSDGGTIFKLLGDVNTGGGQFDVINHTDDVELRGNVTTGAAPLNVSTSQGLFTFGTLSSTGTPITLTAGAEFEEYFTGQINSAGGAISISAPLWAKLDAMNSGAGSITVLTDGDITTNDAIVTTNAAVLFSERTAGGPRAGAVTMNPGSSISTGTGPITMDPFSGLLAVRNLTGGVTTLNTTGGVQFDGSVVTNNAAFSSTGTSFTITQNGLLDTNGGAVTLTHSGAMTLAGTVATDGGSFTSTGGTTFENTAAIGTSGGPLSITGRSGAMFIRGNITTGAGSQTYGTSGQFTLQNVLSTTNAPVSITATAGFLAEYLSQILTAGGSVTIASSAANRLDAITTGGGAVTVTGSDVQINNTINAGAGNITFVVSTNPATVYIGDDAQGNGTGGYRVSTPEIGLLTTSGTILFQSGGGNDTWHAAPHATRPFTIDGGAGTDAVTFYLLNFPGAVVGASTVTSGSSQTLTYVNFESAASNVPPAPVSTRLFDFDFGGAPTQSGYTSVLPTTLYNTVQQYGWISSPTGVDRGAIAGAQADLRRDFHSGVAGGGGARSFRTDVPNGTYYVNVTLGDASAAQTGVSVVAEGTTVISGVNTASGVFFHDGFTVSVTDGTLDLTFSATGSSWAANGLEVRPNPVGGITLTSGPGSVTANGTTIDVIIGSAPGLPNGSLVTITTSLGTITSDASTQYAGAQASVTGGVFSFSVQRPSTAGTPAFRFEAVNGAAEASITDSAIASYTAVAPPPGPPVKRFDFNTAGSPTAAGFTSVLPTQQYNGTNGYGYLEVPGLGGFDRGAGAYSKTTVDLYRDGHSGYMNMFGGAVRFRVRPDAGFTTIPYDVRLYVGDFTSARNHIRLRYGTSTTSALANTAANQFTSVTLTGLMPVYSTHDGNYYLDLTIEDVSTTFAPADYIWTINGLDVAASSVGLPATAPLAADEGSAADTVPLSDTALQPLVAEAIARWSATGVDVSPLSSVEFVIADLSADGELGRAGSRQIVLDDDGGGHGWFVDPSPSDDAEFADSSAAEARMDLLTVVMHELGHVLGLTDDYDPAHGADLMSGTLSPGVRKSPSADSAARQFAAPVAALLYPTDVFAALGAIERAVDRSVPSVQPASSARVVPVARWESDVPHDARELAPARDGFVRAERARDSANEAVDAALLELLATPLDAA